MKHFRDLEDLLMPIWFMSVIQAQPKKKAPGMGKSFQPLAGTFLATLPRSAASIYTQTEVFML